MEHIIVSAGQMGQIKKLELDVLIEIDRICRKHGIRYFIVYGTLIGAVRHRGFIPWDDDIDVGMLRKDFEQFQKICETELSEKYFYQTHHTDPEYYHLMDKIRVNGTVFREAFLAGKKIHHGVFVDIFPFDNVPDNTTHRKLHILHYQLFRFGLMSRFLNVSERKGLKKVAAVVLRVLFTPFSSEFLYRKCVGIARKYGNMETRYVMDLADTAFVGCIYEKKWLAEQAELSFEGYHVMAPKHFHEMLSDLYGDYMALPPEEKRVPLHSLTELRL